MCIRTYQRGLPCRATEGRIAVRSMHAAKAVPKRTCSNRQHHLQYSSKQLSSTRLRYQSEGGCFNGSSFGVDVITSSPLRGQIDASSLTNLEEETVRRAGGRQPCSVATCTGRLCAALCRARLGVWVTLFGCWSYPLQRDAKSRNHQRHAHTGE